MAYSEEEVGADELNRLLLWIEALIMLDEKTIELTRLRDWIKERQDTLAKPDLHP